MALVFPCSESNSQKSTTVFLSRNDDLITHEVLKLCCMWIHEGSQPLLSAHPSLSCYCSSFSSQVMVSNVFNLASSV